MKNESVHKEICMHIIIQLQNAKIKNQQNQKEKKISQLLLFLLLRHTLGRVGYLFNIVQILRPTFHIILNSKTLKGVSSLLLYLITHCEISVFHCSNFEPAGVQSSYFPSGGNTSTRGYRIVQLNWNMKLPPIWDSFCH